MARVVMLTHDYFVDRKFGVTFDPEQIGDRILGVANVDDEEALEYFDGHPSFRVADADEADEDEGGDELPFDPNDFTLGQVKERLDDVEDADTVRALREADERSTTRDYDARIAELEEG